MVAPMWHRTHMVMGYKAPRCHRRLVKYLLKFTLPASLRVTYPSVRLNQSFEPSGGARLRAIVLRASELAKA